MRRLRRMWWRLTRRWRKPNPNPVTPKTMSVALRRWSERATFLDGGPDDVNPLLRAFEKRN